MLLVPVLVLLCSSVYGKQLADIEWRSTNAIFRIDNTKHVFKARINDRVNIKCPPCNMNEATIIYRVGRNAYNNCHIDASARPIGECVCEKTQTPATLTLVFREFSPTGLEYIPNNSYYFITTSDGTRNGLARKRGGLCRTKNMRFRIDIVDANYVETTTPMTTEPGTIVVHSPKVHQAKPRPYPDVESAVVTQLNNVEDDLFSWWRPSSAPENTHKSYEATTTTVSTFPFEWPDNADQWRPSYNGLQVMHDDASRKARTDSSNWYIVHEIGDDQNRATRHSRTYAGNASPRTFSLLVLLFSLSLRLFC